MAHLTFIESTVGFVLLIAGIYAFLWGLWFLGVSVCTRTAIH
jgi:hypothetical protein